MIVKFKGKWCVKSKDGSKTFGCYATKDDAIKRLQQIEFFAKLKSRFKSKGGR